LVHPLGEEEERGSAHQGVVNIKEGHSLLGECHHTSLANLQRLLGQARSMAPRL